MTKYFIDLFKYMKKREVLPPLCSLLEVVLRKAATQEVILAEIAMQNLFLRLDPAKKSTIP